MNDHLNPTKWKEVDYSPFNCENNVTYANELMHKFAMDPNINAVIPVGGWPMFDPQAWKDFVNGVLDKMRSVVDEHSFRQCSPQSKASDSQTEIELLPFR